MSVRHTPRQVERERERDVRLHESHPIHPHPLSAPQHPQQQQQPPPQQQPQQPPPLPPPPPSHMNGNGLAALSLSNGGTHGHPPPHISPKAPPPPTATNVPESIQKLVSANEQTWLVIGSVAEQMGDLEHALSAYENALRHNAYSIPGLTQVAGIARIKENFQLAVEYFQRVLNLQPDNGEIWSALGHCYLMQDDLQKAYQAYQHALYSLPNPKENPKLWYGIGILYDRYGSLDNAEEAFSSVLKMDKVSSDFDKSNEVLFRLGIIYKQQTKYDESLRCFERILRNPPSPLANADIFFQIGHVYEQQGDFNHAREAYMRVVDENPIHAKVLQQLGWLYHQDGTSFQNQELATQYLTKSLETDPGDAQSWYLLGRAFMAGQKYNKAYEAYQQAVYRDGRNPTFWCSIGVLYFQINQYRDALDAYSRAIRINPYIPEVWFDLGSLYESCNNQIGDAIDAYARAAELDPTNISISQRLSVLKHSQATGAQIPAAPPPQDVHPTAYANAAVPPPAALSTPLLVHNPNSRPPFRAESRGPVDGGMPPPNPSSVNRTPPAPFRGGPPPPVVIDESRQGMGMHPHLAPMDVDNAPPPPPAARDVGPGGYPMSSDRGHTSSVRHLSLLLHPAQEPEPARAGPSHPHDGYYSRGRGNSITASPPSAHAPRPRSPATSPYHSYNPAGRPPVGPGSHSHVYAHDPVGPAGTDRDPGWERREWERERERRGGARAEYPVQQSPYYPRGASPPPPSHRRSPRPVSIHERTPPQTSPVPAPPGSRGGDPRYGGPPQHLPPVSPRSAGDHPGPRGEPMQVDRVGPQWRGNERPYEREMGYAPMAHGPPPPPFQTAHGRTSESPHMSSDRQPGRRRGTITKEKEPEPLSGPATVPHGAPPSSTGIIAPEPKNASRKKKSNRKKDDNRSQTETPKPYGPSSTQSGQFKPYGAKVGDSPEPGSSNGSHSSTRSVQPSPTTAAPQPIRNVDEDYDEGVADVLVNLSQQQFRAPEPVGPGYPGPMSGPGMQAAPRQSSPSPSMRSRHSHRGSISSNRSQNSPPVPTSTKRMRSPGPPEDTEMKRTKMEPPRHRLSSPPPPPQQQPQSQSQQTSSRPSPIPFRTQPTSVSPDERQGPRPMSTSRQHSYPPSPPLPAVLPPPPQARSSSSSHTQAGVALPPIATLSPASTAPSPTHERDGEKATGSQSPRGPSPPSRNKLADVMNPASGSNGSSSKPSSTGDKEHAP